MKYSPTLIPYDKIPEQKGSLELKIRNGKLYDPPGNVIFFDEIVGKTHFKLYRDAGFDLIFEQNHSNKGRREARINLKNLGLPQALGIILTWNEKDITLSVGKSNKSDLSTSSGRWTAEHI